MSVFSGYLIICFLLNLILGATSSEFHSISSTSESPQNQEELKKWKQKTKIDEKGENKRHIKLLKKVVVNSNNNLLYNKALKNYLIVDQSNQFIWNCTCNAMSVVPFRKTPKVEISQDKYL